MDNNKKHILIVEDEEALRISLKANLENEGYEVTEAKDGEEGLMAIESHKPDLVLLDIVMPRMDGISMLKKVRANANCANLPIIILSNLSGAEIVSQAISNDVHDYLIKSDWKLEDLMVEVKKKLQ